MTQHTLLTIPAAILAVFCITPTASLGQNVMVDPTVRTEGAATSSSLESDVSVSYDRFGVPTVQAEGRFDAYFAEGFLHAQNRFTQMDISRRLAAGKETRQVGAECQEAAATVGPQELGPGAQ